MHELSIVMSVVEIAEKTAEKHSITSFSEIELDIGTLSGIEIDALNFVWKAGVRNSVLQDAAKRINLIEGEAICDDCEKEYNITDYYEGCPACEGFSKTIIKGQELKVKSLIH